MSESISEGAKNLGFASLILLGMSSLLLSMVKRGRASVIWLIIIQLNLPVNELKRDLYSISANCLTLIVPCPMPLRVTSWDLVRTFKREASELVIIFDWEPLSSKATPPTQEPPSSRTSIKAVDSRTEDGCVKQCTSPLLGLGDGLTTGLWSLEYDELPSKWSKVWCRLSHFRQEPAEHFWHYVS